jgi:hypothetical protein
MQHDPLEGVASVGHDDEAAGDAAGAEHLLDRAATGYQLLACGKRLELLRGARGASVMTAIESGRRPIPARAARAARAARRPPAF